MELVVMNKSLNKTSAQNLLQNSGTNSFLKIQNVSVGVVFVHNALDIFVKLDPRGFSLERFSCHYVDYLHFTPILVGVMNTLNPKGAQCLRQVYDEVFQERRVDRVGEDVFYHLANHPLQRFRLTVDTRPALEGESTNILTYFLLSGVHRCRGLIFQF